MNDQQLITITREVDVTVENLCKLYEISPLSLTAVFLARLKLFNDSIGSSDDFNKLLTTVVETKTKSQEYTIQ